MKAVLAMMFVISSAALAYDGEQRKYEITIRSEETMLERVHRYDEQEKLDKLLRIEDQRFQLEKLDRYRDREEKDDRED